MAAQGRRNVIDVEKLDPGYRLRAASRGVGSWGYFSAIQKRRGKRSLICASEGGEEVECTVLATSELGQHDFCEVDTRFVARVTGVVRMEKVARQPSKIVPLELSPEQVIMHRPDNPAIFGCPHYRKACLVRSDNCRDESIRHDVPCSEDEFFGCRFCHNDEKIHEIDRREISSMICMYCAQDRGDVFSQSVAQECVKCNSLMARYYCDVCKFFDDEPGRAIYHCDDCGICRRGKREDFIHCKVCNACLPADGNHKCLEDVLKSGCPVCHEDMFTSTESATFLKCGHAIHRSCQQSLMENGFDTCPICKKSFLDAEAEAWKTAAIQRHMQIHKMPQEFHHLESTVLCNECLKHSKAPFHFQFHKCGECGSYNTDFISKAAIPGMEPLPPAPIQSAEQVGGDQVEAVVDREDIIALQALAAAEEEDDESGTDSDDEDADN